MNAQFVCRFVLLSAFCALAAELVSADTFGSGAHVFELPFVRIGNPGNAPDLTGQPSPAGSVAYSYRIGQFEVSEQMIEAANVLGGLGLTKDSRGLNMPATAISWNEAARFVNWLNTSTGHMPAYKFDVQPGSVGYNANSNIKLWEPTDQGYDPSNLFRNSQAYYFLPSADEWYKAAFYNPNSGTYHKYTTGSNDVPDGIDFVGDPQFDAIFNDGGFNSAPNVVANVGLLSSYGTAGQGGNVAEWEETEYDLLNDSPSDGRGRRGGSRINPLESLSSSLRGYDFPPNGFDIIGFRVASVPEPTATALATLASLFVLRCKNRKQ